MLVYIYIYLYSINILFMEILYLHLYVFVSTYIHIENTIGYVLKEAFGIFLEVIHARYVHLVLHSLIKDINKGIYIVYTFAGKFKLILYICKQNLNHL